MKPIDVHAHVQFHFYDEDRQEVITKALEELQTFINVGADVETSQKAVADAHKWPIFASVGIHPDEAVNTTEDMIEVISKLATDERVVAMGEIGLDFGKDREVPESEKKKQIQVLRNQLQIAQIRKKPVIFHCRDAYNELYQLLKQDFQGIKGLIHCWMGTENDMENFLSLGLGISFTGNVSYKKNEWIRECAKLVPEEKLFIETDCPFLPPQPIRGSRNEPRFVTMVAETIAQVKNKPLDSIIEVTNKNSKQLFNLPE